MTKRRVLLVAFSVLVILNSGLIFAVDTAVPSLSLKAPWSSPDGTPLPFRGDQQVLDFLSTARVVSMKQISEGINKTRKFLLEKDGLRITAFRTVHSDRYIPDPDRLNRPTNPFSSLSQGLLRSPEIDCLLERRDQLVEQVAGLIRERGRENVICAMG